MRQLGIGTLGSCLKGWQLQRPFPSVYGRFKGRRILAKGGWLQTCRGCARTLPAGQSGTGTLGGCLKGWQFQRPFPSSPLSSSSPSLII